MIKYLEATPYITKDDIDSPILASTNLITVLGSLGFQEASVLSPTSVATGQGHDVCCLLNWLCDTILKRKKSIQKPTYILWTNDDEYSEDIAQDESLCEDSEEVSEEEKNVVSRTLVTSTLEDHEEQIMMTTTDSMEWQLECERLAGALKKVNHLPCAPTSDWDIHLDNLRQHRTTLVPHERDKGIPSIVVATVSFQLKNIIKVS